MHHQPQQVSTFNKMFHLPRLHLLRLQKWVWGPLRVRFLGNTSCLASIIISNFILAEGVSIRDKALISVENENGRLRFQIRNRDKALEKRMEEIDRLKLEVAALKVSLQNERIRHQQCLNKLQVVFFVICSF